MLCLCVLKNLTPFRSCPRSASKIRGLGLLWAHSEFFCMVCDDGQRTLCTPFCYCTCHFALPQRKQQTETRDRRRRASRRKQSARATHLRALLPPHGLLSLRARRRLHGVQRAARPRRPAPSTGMAAAPSPDVPLRQAGQGSSPVSPHQAATGRTGRPPGRRFHRPRPVRSSGPSGPRTCDTNVHLPLHSDFLQQCPHN